MGEQLGQIDLEQADEERRTVAASMTEQLRNLHNFLQNDQDALETQLQRKKNDRNRKIQAHNEKKRKEQLAQEISPSSRNKKNLVIDTGAQRIVTRKFRRAAFSRMMLEEVTGPPAALPSPSSASRPRAPPIPAC